MDNRNIRVLEMLIRVRQFGASHADEFPTGSRGAELFTLVNAAITNIEAHSTSQDSGRRASQERTTLKKIALAGLRENLEALSRTARAMALSTPGLADKFRMPRSNGEQASLTAARSFAADAEPLKAEFIRRGLPASFLEDLSAGRDALEELVNSKAQKTGARVAARVAVSEAADDGRNAVRELDAIVRNVFRNEPAALAEWESASHTGRSSSRRAKTETKAPQPTPSNG
jgi:hypothetical protein